ncbi:MAG: hypothetical protein OXE50_16165, partial [Chloroflexi bacterium]|nr:hypothetical protein [Chloroflexota bacterium]
MGDVADTAAIGSAGLEGEAAAHEYNRLANEDPAAANEFLARMNANPEGLGGPPPSMSLFTGAPEGNEGRTLDLNDPNYSTEFRNDYDAAYADAFGHNTGLIPTLVNNSLVGRAYEWGTGDQIMPVTEANPTGTTTGVPLYEQPGFDINNVDNLLAPTAPEGLGYVEENLLSKGTDALGLSNKETRRIEADGLTKREKESRDASPELSDHYAITAARRKGDDSWTDSSGKKHTFAGPRDTGIKKDSGGSDND